MSAHVKTIFNSQCDLSSDAEGFYKNYWSESGLVKKETLLKNKAIIDKFYQEGISKKTVLEIGVGGEGGILLQLMHDNDVHGMDVSDSAINNCRRFGLPVTKANLDSDTIPFQPETFDIVFAFEVFEHFSNPQHAVEEIRRVLKPGGIFISSVPATCTYHWPRLFYASLFEPENFKEFLMANEFRVTCLDDWLIQNSYRRYKVPNSVKSWSWYFRAEKLTPSDAQGYLELGQHFWSKRNEFGLRTRPIEAVDLFRKSLKLTPDQLGTKLLTAHALLYRAINGDRDEFSTLTNEIMSDLMKPDTPNKVECLAKLLLIHVEGSRLGLPIFSPEEYVNLKSQLGPANCTQSLVDEIFREEEISRQLAAID